MITPSPKILIGNIIEVPESTGYTLIGGISSAEIKIAYESNIDTNVYTDSEKSLLLELSYLRPLPPIVVVDDYQIDINDIYRSSIRVNSTTLKTMTMPPMSEEYDGSSVTFEIIGDGDVKLLRKDMETLVNQTHVSLTGTQKYSSITLRYCHELRAWLVRESVGSWTGGAS